MSGGASILALPNVDDETLPSKSRSVYKPTVSLSAKGKIEPPPSYSESSLPTQNEIELYSRLRRGGMTDNEIMAQYPELSKIKEKQDRDRMIQEMANRPDIGGM